MTTKVVARPLFIIQETWLAVARISVAHEQWAWRAARLCLCPIAQPQPRAWISLFISLWAQAATQTQQ